MMKVLEVLEKQTRTELSQLVSCIAEGVRLAAGDGAKAEETEVAAVTYDRSADIHADPQPVFAIM
ncbi:hypothetical protein KIN20_014367 [Parelaphostrongylus tenuis]|uniref:Uncharacterized protein n=1 Tax=Parelaphostrongylus tenuis TaxID=148309 RepID=A0AAD5MW00_PARTN|nr:hypothetical protein KIN20_014367 [Parelaphostrongylus tenuis]